MALLCEGRERGIRAMVITLGGWGEVGSVCPLLCPYSCKGFREAREKDMFRRRNARAHEGGRVWEATCSSAPCTANFFPMASTPSPPSDKACVMGALLTSRGRSWSLWGIHRRTEKLS